MPAPPGLQLMLLPDFARRAVPRRSQEALMIPRYSRPQMSSIWAPEARFRIWFEIEAHALDAMAELGIVPREAAEAVWAKGGFDVERSEEHTSELQSLAYLVCRLLLEKKN